MKNKILIFGFFILLISCNENYKFDKDEKVILLKSKDYEIYSSKKLFSENLKNWISKYNIEEDKRLLNIFENNENQNPLDLYKLTVENFLKFDRLKFRTSELLRNKKAYVFNLKNNTHEKITIDSCSTNHFFYIGNDTLFVTLDRIY